MKDDRRKEWDRLIEEVRSGAPMDDAKNLERIRELKGPVMPQKNIQLPSFNDYERTIYKAKPIPIAWGGIRWTISPESQVTPSETQLSVLNSHPRQSLTPQAQRAPMKASVESPLPDSNQNLWNLEQEEDSEGLLPREPKNRLHVDSMEDMVARLISRLLLESRNVSTLSPSSPSENAHTAKEKKKLAQRIEALQSGGMRLPSFSFDDTQVVRRERMELGRSIAAIFENGASQNDSIELMVSKLCYNLLISTSPPSINIYYTMIDHFAQMKLFSLSQLIVDSFFSDSRFCANQTFAQSLLNNYASNNDRDGFKSIVRCMQAREGNMKIRKEHISRLIEPGVQKWALQNKVIHRNRWLIQKFPRSASTFECLIRNSLKLEDMSSVIRHFRSALREGQQINTELIYDIIKQLVDTLNWRAGLSFLHALLKQWETDNPSVKFSKRIRFMLYQLFSLCGITLGLRSFHRAVHAVHIMGSEKPLPPKISRKALNNLLRYLQFESITDSIDRISTCLLSVDYALGIAPFSYSWSSTAFLPIESGIAADVNLPPSKVSLILRYHQDTSKSFDRALAILERYPAREKWKLRKKAQQVVYNQMVLIQTIENKLSTLKTRIEVLQFKTASFSYDKLSEKYRVAYNSYSRASPWWPISRKLRLLSALAKQDSAERHRFHTARDRTAAHGLHGF
ncbi:hypothetical protein B7494_g2315 [Chlorociboria aeruginascens]|nr:hypothetical protein B7494_g2315 [Chlorociboria aeruginascens]